MGLSLLLPGHALNRSLIFATLFDTDTLEFLSSKLVKCLETTKAW
jgi:hypothetical protein